jgi:methionine biosynthesis protein MetW
MKLEHRIIVDLVPRASSVLDLGCGNGDLMHLLATEKGTRAHGIEIDERAIYECVAKGLSVLHGDLDTGLVDFSDRCFDYVILDQTLQQLERPDDVLADALRVGKKVIVGFPNFAHHSARLQILLRGRSPVTPFLPYQWHDTPNLRFFSILDFTNYCREKRIAIEKAVYVSNSRVVKILPNLRADVGIFQIARTKA